MAREYRFDFYETATILVDSSLYAFKGGEPMKVTRDDGLTSYKL